jgi:prefoldin subunit 5
MENIVSKAQNWILIIGLITTLGGGFYAWGQFNTRLETIESLQGSDFTEKLQKRVATLETANEVLRKTIEVLDAKMNELALKVSNPLGN